MKLVKRRRNHAAIAAWLIAALTVVVVAVGTFTTPRDWVVNDRLYAGEIQAAARRHGLDPQLVRALIFQESRFNPRARGRSGELGLMQLLPEGAVAEWSRLTRHPLPTEEELLSVEPNLDIGCWYLSRGIEKYRKYAQGTEMALAWYNAGESRVNRWKPEDPDGEFVGRIDISSTTAYVKKIMARYRKYLETAAEYSDSAGK